MTSDLLKYRQESPQFEVWAKEIKDFKNHMTEKANQFQIVPNYKELKIFSMKSKVLDSPRDIESHSNKLLRKVASKPTFSNIHAESVREEEENNRKYSGKRSDETTSVNLNTSYNNLMSTEGKNFNHKTPLLVELHRLSFDKSKDNDEHHQH